MNSKRTYYNNNQIPEQQLQRPRLEVYCSSTLLSIGLAHLYCKEFNTKIQIVLYYLFFVVVSRLEVLRIAKKIKTKSTKGSNSKKNFQNIIWKIEKSITCFPSLRKRAFVYFSIVQVMNVPMVQSKAIVKKYLSNVRILISNKSSWKWTVPNTGISIVIIAH